MILKYTKIFIINFILFLSFHSWCLASNWYQVDKKLWIDYESLKTEHGTILVWEKQLNPGNWQKYKNKYVWYSIDLCKYNCATRKFDIVESNCYGLNHQFLDSFNPLTEYWMNIIPDSRHDKVYNIICK